MDADTKAFLIMLAVLGLVYLMVHLTIECTWNNVSLFGLYDFKKKERRRMKAQSCSHHFYDFYSKIPLHETPLFNIVYDYALSNPEKVAHLLKKKEPEFPQEIKQTPIDWEDHTTFFCPECDSFQTFQNRDAAFYFMRNYLDYQKNKNEKLIRKRYKKERKMF